MHLHLRGAISFCRENTLCFDVFLLPIDRLACHAMQCTSSLRCPSACYSMTRALIQNFNQIIQYNSSKHVIVLSGSHTGILFCEKGYVGVWRGHGPLKIPVIWNRKRLFVKWKTSLETNHILWWKKKTERESHTQKIHCFEGKLRKAKHDSSLTCSVWSYEPKLHFWVIWCFDVMVVSHARKQHVSFCPGAGTDLTQPKKRSWGEDG